LDVVGDVRATYYTVTADIAGTTWNQTDFGRNGIRFGAPTFYITNDLGGSNVRIGQGTYGWNNLIVEGNIGVGMLNPGSGLWTTLRPNLDVAGSIAFNREHRWDGDTYAKWGAFRRVRLINSPYIEMQVEDGNAYGISIWLSTEKAKTNISNLGIDSNKVYKLRPVSFNWKTQPDGPKTFGLIAEETAQVIPELVSYDEKNNPHHVNYELLSVLLLDQLQKIRNEGLILKDTDGPGCHKITVNSNGVIMTTPVPCP
jgi:hypothetical protein